MEVTEEVKTRTVCDICKKTIVGRQRKYDCKCQVCGKDICYNHLFMVIKKKKIRSYNYKDEIVGIYCTECFNTQTKR